MTRAAEEVLGPRLHAGLVIAPNVGDISTSPDLRSQVFRGARNNLPDMDSVTATQRALESLYKNDATDTVFLFLISGGGSALFCAPDGITLEEKLSTIRALTANGADIRVLNAFRQKLSTVKGGKTLNYITKGEVVALIISDLVSNQIQFIASGPTIPQTTAMLEMSEALTTSPKWTALLPEKILARLKVNPPSPKVNPHNIIIASITTALSALQQFFTSKGYDAHVVTSTLVGDATQRGKDFAELLMTPKQNLHEALHKFAADFNAELGNKIALLFGGETTVIIRGKGKGGRSQEMALSCLANLSSSSLPKFLFLAAGTDGQDGPTDATGAYVTNNDVNSDIVERCTNYLKDSNSYEFWSTYNHGSNHIKPGPTGTNVMDVQIVLMEFAQ
ncbi:unnamed protein product [Cylicocyclus nassatus]|uniref:Glycerate kinase n=1 Tax=Cylicocyclus nassatus TaxID=53992 RepID=A0AA36GWA4_CYLNA|nr:unnamed protein product [Cylicocyclus nassatus]